MNKEKKDAYYFSHDSNARNDIKILRLRRSLGLEGYGIYFCLIEMLREQDDYKMSMSSIPDVAFELHASDEKVKAVICAFDLFVIDNDEFFSARLNRSMEEYKSLKTKLSEAGRKGGLSKAKAGLKPSQSPPLALKERKVKKRKEKESKDENKDIQFDVFWNLYDKKVSKEKSVAKWNKLSYDDKVKIIQTLPAFIAKIKDKQYQPHPDTYLNNRRWEDEETPKIPYINDGINHHDKNRYQSYVEYVEFCTIKKLPIIITEEEYYAK